MSVLRARWLGRMPYQEAWDLQRAFHEGRASGRAAADYLLLLEHPPTYTIGTGGDAAHVLASPEELARLGAEVLRVDRGGDVTYHGPGQLVGYPIVHLGEQPDVVAYVRRLEQVLIRALADLGIAVLGGGGVHRGVDGAGQGGRHRGAHRPGGHHARLRGERVRATSTGSATSCPAAWPTGRWPR